MTASWWCTYTTRSNTCPGKIDLNHYSIKNQTPWTAFAWKHYSTHQVMKQWETYATIAEELQEIKNWLHKCYEADAEIREVEQCCGDLRRKSSPRNSLDQCPGNETLFVGTDKKGTCQPGMKIHPAGSESYPDEGNNLSCQCPWELESLERKKYTLSQDEIASLDMCILSPRPINKSKKDPEQAPVKKKSITVEEYHVREECRHQEQECQDAECRQQEEEALQKLNEMWWWDQEDRASEWPRWRSWKNKKRRLGKMPLRRHILNELKRRCRWPRQRSPHPGMKTMRS